MPACSVTPYYNKPTQEGLFRHYSAVAEAVDIPLILYNVPGRTALDMAPTTTARLSRLPNVVGVKEAFGDPARIVELVETCEAGFTVVTGDDATAMESCLGGGHGDISVTANVVPRQMQEMCAAAMAGERAPRRGDRGRHQRICTGCCFSSRTRSRSSGRWPRWVASGRRCACR